MATEKIDKKKKQVDLSSFYKAVEDRTKRKQRELPKQRDQVLEQIFGDGPKIDIEDDEEVRPKVQDSNSLEPSSKSKKQRRWRPAWKLEHPWAYPVVVEGMLRIKCE
ncbi:hypothetical protein GOP47_0031200 [Adiantum capillus-veneris]|nr:hypothetical protein GOP47_0031200 [Adiantum capillus-veneris]